MESSKLIKDDEKQSSLRDDTKYFAEKAFTTVIEIMMGKPIIELTQEEKSVFEDHLQFKGKPLISHNETTHEDVIEYTSAVRLLIEYFAATGKPFCQKYMNRIVKEQQNSDDSDDFVEKKFRIDFKAQCDKERRILEILRDTRNDERGHDTERADMGIIYNWIHQLMRYLDCFTSYRMNVLRYYDSNYGKKDDRVRLDDLYTKASDLKDKCFASKENKENYTEFRFGRNIYKISKDEADKADFGLLLSDMARNWYRGIQYLKNRTSSDSFHKFLEAYCENYDDVLDYEEKHQAFMLTAKDSNDESIQYMSIIYSLYPIQGLYCKEKIYSDSRFSSRVLQTITRHNGRFSLAEKKDTLKFRIDQFEKWNETDEKHKGIGINLISLCKEGILYQYFKGKKDSEGMNKAKAFETEILSSCEDSYIEENYDKVIKATLMLITHMKGSTTYMLPILEELDGDKKYITFKTPDEFRDYFRNRLKKADSISDISNFVHCIQDDNNLKWFIENESAGKDV